MAEERCTAGQWVEVERALLEPADRAENLPDDTAAQPLRVWVKGFAVAPAEAGEECEVETMTGRTVRGTLSDCAPGYTHSFGTPPPEIVAVGRDLRARLAAYRADGTGAPAAPRAGE